MYNCNQLEYRLIIDINFDVNRHNINVYDPPIRERISVKEVHFGHVTE